MTGPAEIFRHLATEAAPDRDLLRRYSENRDGDAFAELVKRHGPVVLAAARRGVRHRHDADDVFQAVFLVLAKRAGAIDRPDLLGNWLYGVTVRVTQHARRAAARRGVREVQGVEIPERAAPEPVPNDLGPVVDEELGALPAWHRDAIVLCDLRGLSRADAAAALGIPLGTLASRLDAGRKKLAARLARRGVTLSVGAVLVEARAVAVSDSLLNKTCEIVAVWSAGGALPPPLVNLAQGGLPVRRTMFLGLVAAVATTVVGVGLMAQTPPTPPRAAPPPLAAPPAVAVADPKPVGPTVIPRMRRAMDLSLSSANGVVLHPNGKTVAVYGRVEVPSGEVLKGEPGLTSVPRVLLVRDVFDRNAAVDGTSWDERVVGFTPDGKRLITDLREHALASGFHRLTYWNVEPGTSESLGGTEPRTADLDADQTSGYAFAPDGKSFRTVFYGVRKATGYDGLEVREVDAATGRTAKTVFKVGDGGCARFGLSADGKVLVTVWPAPARPDVGVSAYDVDKGEHLWTRVTAVDGDPVSRDGLTPEVGVSPRGDRVVVGFGTSRLLVLNGKTGEPLPALQGDRPFVQVRGRLNAAFSADGRLLAASGLAYPTAGAFRGPTHKSMFCVWEAATGRVVRFSDGVTAVMGFHPSRPLLALVEKNGGKTRLGLWDFAAQP